MIRELISSFLGWDEDKTLEQLLIEEERRLISIKRELSDVSNKLFSLEYIDDKGPKIWPKSRFKVLEALDALDEAIRELRIDISLNTEDTIDE